MHDCRKTKEDLIDLVFNEASAGEELRLLEELEACRNCRAEYQAMQESLGMFDEAAHAMLPAAGFWPAHHARLEERLAQALDENGAGPLPFWRRAFGASFSIPVPAAIAAALLLAATSVLAIRSFIFRPQAPQAAATQTKSIQYVEVPVEKRVVEERIVTRTVYVTKRAAGRGHQAAPSLQDLPGMTAQNAGDDNNKASERATLNGFQPSADVKLTVIKGSSER